VTDKTTDAVRAALGRRAEQHTAGRPSPHDTAGPASAKGLPPIAVGHASAPCEILLLRGIPFRAQCEDRQAAITGKASIAYAPCHRVAGISTLAQVVEGNAHTLCTLESMAAKVAQFIWDHLAPHGVAVVIETEHGGMGGWDLSLQAPPMVTNRILGCFLDDPGGSRRLLSMLGY
jgi:GTP cyclohydrolase I